MKEFINRIRENREYRRLRTRKGKLLIELGIFVTPEEMTGDPELISPERREAVLEFRKINEWMLEHGGLYDYTSFGQGQGKQDNPKDS